MYGWKQCREETADRNLIQRFFACVPSVIDYRWRLRDFKLHRSYDGPAKRVLGIDGHSPLAYLLPALFLVFLVWGPTLGWRGWGAPIVLATAWTAVWLGARRWGAEGLFWVEIVVLVAVAEGLWWLVDPGSLEAGGQLFRHALLPGFELLVVLPLLLTRWLARGLFRDLRTTSPFADFLPHVNLFVKPPRAPRVTLGGILRSLVNVPLQQLLPLLFFPSLILLFLPYYAHLEWWAVVLVAATWLLLSFASLHERFNSLLPLVRRTFFIGGQLVVSMVIIVLAVGRLAGISYVQTVVESSSWGTLLTYVVAAYSFFWFFEYWLNRQLLDQLVALLQGDGDPVGQASYDVDPAEPFAAHTAIALDDRLVQAHGGARLISIGKLAGGAEAFQPFEKRQLFDALVAKATRSPIVGRQAASETTARTLAQLHSRIRFYFSFANLFLVLVAVGAGLLLTRLPQQPLAVVETPAPATGVDLAKLLQPTPARRDLVLLAASGGGTRAALYTESVLRGLHDLGALDDLVLASGVSGGGAALAYYGAHRQELRGDAGDDSWDRFACDLSYPFIWDVIEGVSEWRIVGGTRSGQLLAESLCRNFHGVCPGLGTRGGEPGGDLSGDPGGVPSGDFTIGEVDDLGLIFNTALAGHLSCPECAQAPDFPGAAADRRRFTDGSVAGGRLVFTNLDGIDAFPLEPSSTGMPWVAVRDPSVPLARAGALNANFPPVFSNAPVDRDHTDRYWVTDGGATDNRGLIALLLALRGAILRLPEPGAQASPAPDAERQAAAEPASEPAPTTARLPDLHVVMAEASAGSLAYSQDRGVGTKFGAPGQIASQLIGELLREVTALYAARGGRLLFHDLAMPEFLRLDGGLGTHWMLPRTVKMRDPTVADPDLADKRAVKLDSYAVRQLIDELHQSETAAEIRLCPGESLGWLRARLVAPAREKNLPRVRGWIAASDHQQVWSRLQKELAE